MVIFRGKGHTRVYKWSNSPEFPPHTYYEYCPQYSKLSGVTQQLLYFLYLQIFYYIFKIYTTGGASPPHLGGRKRKKTEIWVKTHIVWLVFDIQVTSLTWPRIKWFMGKWSGIATQRLGEKLEWDCHSQNYKCSCSKMSLRILRSQGNLEKGEKVLFKFLIL